jgi:hypothetical protein
VEKAGMFQGREHLSAVDEAHLRALASSTGLHYRHLDGEDSLFPAVASHVQPRRASGAVPISWMFSLAALVLLIAAALEETMQKFFGSFFQKRTA